MFLMIERGVRNPEPNLLLVLDSAIVKACANLGITTRITAAAEIDIDLGLQAQAKMLVPCEAFGATTCVNAIGGVGLY